MGFRVVVWGVQGYLAHTNHAPAEDHHRSLGIGLPRGPIGGGGLVSEVPLQWFRFGAYLAEM